MINVAVSVKPFKFIGYRYTRMQDGKRFEYYRGGKRKMI